jgi:hypothetical protein
MEIDPLTTLVMVVDAERPTITITGTRNQDVHEHDLSRGVKLFPDLVIDARTKTEDSELKSSSDAKVSRQRNLAALCIGFWYILKVVLIVYSIVSDA